MVITCTHCQKNIQIPDEKIPESKSFSLRCPGCKNRISVDPQPPEAPASAGFEEGDSQDPEDFAVSGEDYDASEKPFDFLEEEGNTAMVLEDNAEIASRAQKVLEIMDYHVTVAKSVRDGLRKMKYHQFDLILLNETFDNSSPEANGVLIYLQRMTMDVRRRMFVALFTERCETMDRMAAFLKSVNVVIHVKDIQRLDRILARALNENDLFYAVFRESLKKLGQY
jgi:CheY-like chemotaxis protein/DNA-directed RNA polymerase subunit RPC12/RpoP